MKNPQIEIEELFKELTILEQEPLPQPIAIRKRDGKLKLIYAKDLEVKHEKENE